MITIVLIVHLLIAIALVAVVLLQRSEGGALGIGGGGMSGFLTGRSTANFLTRTTAMLAAFFFITSMVLAWLAGGNRVSRSIVDQPPASVHQQPVEQEPSKNEVPTPPLAR